MLAFDFRAGPIVPKIREDWRPEDPVDALLSTCPTLLAIVDTGYPYRNVIQFSHSSIEEFLTSVHLYEETDIVLRLSCFYDTLLAAQACLDILLHLDKDFIICISLEDFTLAEYAAEYWTSHAWFEDVSRKVEDGLQ